jgi:hypothetical protein
MMTKALEPRPIFESYYARLVERPAYKRFTEQADRQAAQMKAAAAQGSS